MQRRIIAPLFSVALLSCLGCDSGRWSSTGSTPIGSGRLETRTPAVSGFDAVSVSGAVEVVIVQDGSERLEITAEEDVLPLLHAVVEGRTLRIGHDDELDIEPTRSIVFRLSVRQLDAIRASGVTSIEVVDLAAEDLEITLSGVSTFTAAGTADRLEVRLTGVSELDTGRLASRVVVATVSGVSHARVRVSERLEAEVSGVSVLEYLGDPSVVVSGSGVVLRVGS